MTFYSWLACWRAPNEAGNGKHEVYRSNSTCKPSQMTNNPALGYPGSLQEVKILAQTIFPIESARQAFSVPMSSNLCCLVHLFCSIGTQFQHIIFSVWGFSFVITCT